MKKSLQLFGLSTGVCLLSLSQGASADFLSDSKATLGLRNLYFNNDYRDRPGPAGQSKIEEWAQGFMLNYTSGFTAGTLGFGVDALGLMGVTLDSGAGNHRGSTMIPDDGAGAADQWARLGLTAKARLGKTEARLGTLTPKLPIMTSSDGRLLPQTFEGGQITSNDIDGLTLTGGRLEHATGRGSTDSTGLAVSGGTRQSNDFVFAGADYKVTKNLLAQYYVSNLADYYTQQFFGLQHSLALGEGQSIKTDLRYFDTSSSGANGSASGRAEGYRVAGYTRNNSGEIDNRTWSAAFTYTLGGHSLMGGYQSVSDNSNFVQLNQVSLAGKGAGGASLYLLTDRMIASFNRAGEQTWFGQYAYDFAAVGVPGLRASMIYLKGSDIKTVASGDKSEWERDVALDYVIQDGTFKGVGFGWRYGMLRSQIDPHQDQNRLIVSYTLALF
jgi:hypothetical protein